MFQWLKNIYWRIQKPVMETILNVQNDHNEYLKARMEVMHSPLWDEHYYLQHYPLEFNDYKLLPIDHYLQIGWKKGYNPSALFDNDAYLHRIGNPRNIIPLVHFLLIGRFRSICGYSTNVFPANSFDINRYLEIKSKRTAKSVVYTCITNDYDDLSVISGYRYIDPNWDYVCFSDNSLLVQQKQLGIWEIRPLVFKELDNTRNNRYHKILPYRLFPEYEESIYIDANINITTPYIFEEIQRRNENFLAPTMVEYPCLYKAAQWMLKANVDGTKLEKQLSYFRHQGFPENYRMFENNLLYRRHHQPEIQNIMEEWWQWVKDYCRRDQSSLAYVFWKYHLPIEPYTIHNIWVDYNNFCIYRHIKPREY